MQQTESLTPGNFYHIYNHGVASRDLFYTNDNYEYFLDLYSKYIDPITETYAWVLMKNHFHLLVWFKDKGNVVDVATPDRVQNPVRGEKYKKIGTPSQQFSKLFNSYAQSINNRLGCHGALFERPFKRKLIDNEEFLKNVLLYIHNNPVHHKFCEHAMDYPWSSYLTCISSKPTKLKRDTVMGWFDDEANFKFMHDKKIDIEAIEKWLDLK